MTFAIISQTERIKKPGSGARAIHSGSRPGLACKRRYSTVTKTNKSDETVSII